MKTREAMLSGGIPKKVGVTIIGRQCDSNVLALSHNTFIDEVSGMHYISASNMCVYIYTCVHILVIVYIYYIICFFT